MYYKYAFYVNDTKLDFWQSQRNRLSGNISFDTSC